MHQKYIESHINNKISKWVTYGQHVNLFILLGGNNLVEKRDTLNINTQDKNSKNTSTGISTTDIIILIFIL